MGKNSKEVAGNEVTFPGGAPRKVHGGFMITIDMKKKFEAWVKDSSVNRMVNLDLRCPEERTKRKLDKLCIYYHFLKGNSSSSRNT